MPEKKQNSYAGNFLNAMSSLSKTTKKEAGPNADFTSSMASVAQTLRDSKKANGDYEKAVEAIQKKPALLELVSSPFRLIIMGYDGILSDPPKATTFKSFLYNIGARINNIGATIRSVFPSEKHQAEGDNHSRSFHADGHESKKVSSKELPQSNSVMSSFRLRRNSSQNVDKDHRSKRGMGPR